MEFPVEEFNAARRALDPKNILANSMIDGFFGVPRDHGFVMVSTVWCRVMGVQVKQLPWQC